MQAGQERTQDIWSMHIEVLYQHFNRPIHWAWLQHVYSKLREPQLFGSPNHIISPALRSLPAHHIVFGISTEYDSAVEGCKVDTERTVIDRR